MAAQETTDPAADAARPRDPGAAPAPAPSTSASRQAPTPAAAAATTPATPAPGGPKGPGRRPAPASPTAPATPSGPGGSGPLKRPAPGTEPARSTMAKTTTKTNPSTRRGPSEEEKAKEREEHPALTVPSAWLHFPGASIAYAANIRQHCLSILKANGFAKPLSDPISGFENHVVDAIGVVFSSLDILMAMIMNPPMINGHPVMWKTPAGEIHPFTAIGVPPKKLLRHVRGALREIGTVSHLKQDFINGERVFDWSGILYLPPGQAFPSELRFDFDPNAYALLPAAVALPCPSCYRRDPKTCHCPAPACHYSLVEQRTREQAEAAAAATAPTPLADAPPAAPAPSPTPSPTPAPAPTQAPAEPPATPAAGPTPPRAQALEPGAGTPMPTGAGRAKRRQLARLEGQPEKPADKAAPAHDAPISRQLNTVQAPPPRPVTPTEDSAMDTDPAATRSEKSAKTRLPTRHIAKKKLPALSDRRGPAAAELEATNSASDEDHSMDLADTTSDGDYATDENDSSSDGSSASSEAEPTSDEEHDMDADDPRL
ncbi:hypothetical protein H4R26_005165 [Coemansia thaxteri]|uniref:Uncharacterized protein n=1 Tax=Coemansia thaxteri TaxID=2663907 RepID=A0A9W8BG35_9FUNG|nr:hypothetical protein H4R26_005165 [Coemansia thaxteri]